MEIYDAVVIGAGQAGLSTSYHLRRLGVEHVVLDANDAPGGAWSLMAYGRNLEDEAVLVQAAPDAQNANRLGGSGAYAPPRLYGVQLTARF